MKHKESPCFDCVENNCHGCACAVCETSEDQKDIWWSSKLMESIKKNQDDCDKFIERLWRENDNIAWVENEQGEMVLDQNWRGFPVGAFNQDDWFNWVDIYHTKGVGWVYDNIKA